MATDEGAGAETTAVRPPARRPCASCPYRRDVPSGVWTADEYAKLAEFDGDTWSQPAGVFLCHQRTGNACAGWVAVHDMEHSLALRLAAADGRVADVGAFVDYRTDVPVWDNGAAAAAHGMRDVERPGEEARVLIEKLGRNRERAGA